MKFVLRSAAREDILRQYEYYLSEAGPIVAERFLGAIQTSVEQVCTQPGIGAPRVLKNEKLAGDQILASQRVSRCSAVLPDHRSDASRHTRAAWQKGSWIDLRVGIE